MADIFLMGTAGRADDPHRSHWRDPIKKACDAVGLSYFDPIVYEWNEESRKREAEALTTAKIIIMAVTQDTAGVASLAESGWVALSALLRKQAVGFYIDPNYRGGASESTMIARLDNILASNTDTVEDASRRARKLVHSHATRMATQFPGMNLYVAKDINDLATWTVSIGQKLIPSLKRPPTTT